MPAVWPRNRGSIPDRGKGVSTRFDVLTAVLLKIQVFWDVTLYWSIVTGVLKKRSAVVLRVEQSRKSDWTV
jgi:hypothetical protein